MKKILLPIILFITAFGTTQAQTDYCKDITKSVTESGILYLSPTPGNAKEDIYILGFGKLIDANGTQTYFRLGNSFSDEQQATTNVTLTFEDNSELNFSNLTVTKGKEGAVGIGGYVYHTNILLQASDLEKFKTQKLKFYTFCDKKRYPGLGNPKVKLMAYAACLDGLTQGPAGAPAATAANNPNEKKSIEGFWGIKFGVSVADVKTAIAAKGGKLSVADSKPDMLIFDNVVFTQRKTDMVTAKFIDGKFYEAVVVYPAPEEVELLNKFNTIVAELTNVYGDPRLIKKFEYPYTEGDGHEVLAITSGKATYAAIWTTNNGNTIDVEIKKSGSIYIFYTDATLEKSKDAKKSADY